MKRRIKKIDYHNKKYSNPFFQQRRKKRVRRLDWSFLWRKKIITLSIWLIIIGLGWLFFFSNVFKINTISVEGTQKISSGEIEGLVWDQTKEKRFLFGQQNNLFLFKKNQFIKNLKERYTFDTLEVDKKMPGNLIINVREKSYAFIWRENDKYYYCDIDGYVIDEINPLEIKGKKYPLIENQGQGKLRDIEIDIEKKYIDYIMDLFNNLKGNAQYPIEKFILDNEADTVKLQIAGGPQVFFNINEDQNKQIEKLNIIKDEKLKDDFNKKFYIDLRYGDRVYYR
ncbi:hypothetical protein COV49_04090 [Candidatus Falkowbacteria bacterium CG11_big_fil_rev_8_21_14_0_20_39_10]|uniref:POTRA domain-containing protein n=1 Tax=Candidatus Falkowbacteria bacterium CG11_big_fil_rev_8_21_14_0_20_39_10 TaxID=1974570 RepID=A0A2M6K851_9BACT|nr:MAG: hypothetical protein COV49_04090 [Candidatus Falkowbacteria bacterium CG11_big_fil_rev_8_21_14_0_20_39_10]